MNSRSDYYFKAMTPNQRVRLIRETLKMTQQEFADAIGMSQVGLSNVESGKLGKSGRNVGLSIKLRDKIAKKFNISKAWLEDGEGTMYAKQPVSKFKDEKDHVIALLEDKVRLLQSQIEDKEKIINLLTDKLRANFTNFGTRKPQKKAGNSDL